MNIIIKYVRDCGDPKNERLVMQANADLNIGNYMIFDTTYITPTQISNIIKHNYWFPEKEVAKGDLIVLYTKSGKISDKINGHGNKSHFFYMGIDNKSIWNTDGDCATIVEINDWDFKKIRGI